MENRERSLLEPTGVGASNVDMGGVGVTPDDERASHKVGRARTSGSRSQGKAPRKLRSKHRKLILDIKRCSASLVICISYEQFQQGSYKIQRSSLSSNVVSLRLEIFNPFVPKVEILSALILKLICGII